MSRNVLLPGVIDVWTSSLLCSQTCRSEYEQLLSADELQRANSFRFPHLRSAFVISRGTLRRLLADYSGIKADEVDIAYTNSGKPFLPNSDLHFNVSHSGQCLAFIFAQGMKVGIDVEQIRPLEDMLQVSSQFFATSEVDALRQTPVGQQARIFFQTWTLKEAFVKAIGQGLGCPLDSFAVRLGPEPKLELFDPHPNPQNWFLHTFFPADGYIGGLASEKQPLDVHWEVFSH